MKRYLNFFAIIILLNVFFFSTLAKGEVSPMQSLIYENLVKRNESFTIKYTGDYETLDSFVENALSSALNEDDYIKTSVLTYKWNINEDDEGNSVEFNIEYVANRQQEDYVDSRTKEILKEIINPSMEDVQKEKAIHDYILSNVAYDTSLLKHSAYDALNGSAVCQGYALLAYKMLTEAGIQSRIVVGNIGDQAHAWNLVNIDGNWYHLDCTFDDPTPDKQGRITSYDYFNLTDEEMEEDHDWDRDAYPKAEMQWDRDTINMSTSYIYEVSNLALGEFEAGIQEDEKGEEEGKKLSAVLEGEKGSFPITFQDEKELYIKKNYVHVNFNIPLNLLNGEYRLKVFFQDNPQSFCYSDYFTLDRDFKLLPALKNVPIDKTFRINFSSPIDKATAKGDNIKICDGYTNEEIPCSINSNGDTIGDRYVFIAPLAPLLKAHDYYILIDKGIKNLSGTFLKNTQICSFRTN